MLGIARHIIYITKIQQGHMNSQPSQVFMHAPYPKRSHSMTCCIHESVHLCILRNTSSPALLQNLLTNPPRSNSNVRLSDSRLPHIYCTAASAGPCLWNSRFYPCVIFSTFSVSIKFIHEPTCGSCSYREQ